MSLLNLRRWSDYSAAPNGRTLVHRVPILATACITPPTAGAVARFDAQVRLDDYVKSLAQWLLLPDASVGDLWVLENSGADPSKLGDMVLRRCATVPARRIHVVSYVGRERPAGVHYGFSEFQMIDDLLDDYTDIDGSFVKTTGRYFYPSVGRLIDALPADWSLVFDAKRHPAVPPIRPEPNHVVQVALFAAQRGRYDECVRKCYQEMSATGREDRIEHVLFDKLAGLHGDRGIYLRFPVNCDPVGIGGSGLDLMNRRRRLNNGLRSLLRRTAPGWWL